MRILQVNRSLDPAQGGPVTSTMEISSHFISAGHTVEVVAIDDPAAPYLKDCPVPVHAVGAGGGKYGFNLELPRWISTNAHRFDAAVLHGVWDFSSYGGHLGLRKAKLPYVIYPHGMLDPWFRKGRLAKTLIKQLYWFLAGGPTLAGASYVLFTCEEERRLARGSFIGPSYREKVVAYGAKGVPEGSTIDQVAAFRRSIPSLMDREYLLFMGRIHSKKGGDLLLQAFGALAKDNKNIDLVLAGPDEENLRGRYAPMIDRLGVADRIHWPGMLSGDVKWGALRGAVAFVLPSHQENFGLAVAEAMSCRTPVLVSNKVNIWREIVAGGGGRADDDTIEGTERQLRAILSMGPEERREMGSKARQTYLALLTSEAAANDLAEVLAEISHSPHVGGSAAQKP